MQAGGDWTTGSFRDALRELDKFGVKFLGVESAMNGAGAEFTFGLTFNIDSNVRDDDDTAPWGARGDARNRVDLRVSVLLNEAQMNRVASKDQAVSEAEIVLLSRKVKALAFGLAAAREEHGRMAVTAAAIEARTSPVRRGPRMLELD